MIIKFCANCTNKNSSTDGIILYIKDRIYYIVRNLGIWEEIYLQSKIKKSCLPEKAFVSDAKRHALFQKKNARRD